MPPSHYFCTTFKNLNMKKLILLFVVGAFTASGIAQTTSHKKRPTLGINFMLKDFITPERIASTSLSSVIQNKQWEKVRNMTPGLQVTYQQGLTDHVDFMANLGGSFLDYPFLSSAGVRSNGRDRFLLEADANVNVKLLTDNYFVVPFVSAGLGASMYGGTYFAAYAPVGTGLQFKLSEDAYLTTQWRYHLRVSSLANYHFNYVIGFASPITDPKPVVAPAPPPPPPPPPPPADTDKDGIIDEKDKCPTVPGVAKYDGCPIPDTDGDGINDENDKCPTVKGLAKYQGCPIPDTDKDGINDEEDKCPTVPGVARYQGCPIPDTDGDGVNDEEDKCPKVPGDKDNFGCPKIETSVKLNNIQFKTGSAVLLPIALKELKKVNDYLKANTGFDVVVEGHTDNVGKAANNKVLSQKRAQSVVNYLVKLGTPKERLSAVGYGSEQPVADNKTAAGRTQNRRVAFKIKG